MAKIKKIKEGTATIYPATIPQAVIDPATGKSVRTELNEKVSISELESARSQSTTKAPTSKLMDDELGKTVNAKPGKNLFNIENTNNYLGGYLNVNGNIQPNASYNTTHYIPVTAGVQIYASSVRFVAFYDVNKTFITGSYSDVNQALGAALTPPVGAAFVRISVTTGYYSSDFQVELGNEKTAYEPYSGIGGDPVINSILTNTTSLNLSVMSINSKLDNTIELLIDEDTSIRELTFMPNDPNLSNVHSTSTFSGYGQYIGEVGAFRYLVTKIRCANWNSNVTPVTQVLVQFRQDVYNGALLKEKLFTLANPILPGILADVHLDFEEDISLSGSLFMIIRMNALSTLQKAASHVSPYAVQGRYWVNGNISSINLGTNPTTATYYNSNFWILYSSLNYGVRFTEERIIEIGERLPVENIEIILPDKLYAIVGDTLQLFYRGMIKHPNPYIYDILVTCSKGVQYPRYFQYTPASRDVGTATFKVEIKDRNGMILGSKTCSLITKAAVQSPVTEKKILCVGDSLTSSGTWCIEASRRLTGIGGAPAGLALSNISFLGRKTGSGIGWEGNGGWNWNDYSGAGREAYKFVLSGVITPPAIGSTYTNNGVTYTVSEINLTEGSGYISATGSGAPTASGILTKASGAGDATLTFSSSEQDSGNPFWEADTNSLNFSQYVNTYMGGGCDVIYFLLSWNAQSAHRTDFTTVISSAKTLVDHIHAEYPDCKIKLMGIQLPSLNGGMGASYGATGTSYADMYGMVVTALNMNKAYQDWCNESAYSDFMEFVNVSAQFDSENNMPETDKAVNTRSTKTEKIGTSGVHPSTEGYYQIGDAVFRNFVANFCQ